MTTREAADAEKQQRYGDAQFLHQLPAGQQLTIILTAKEQP